jgi:hypothetical protein
MKMGPNLTKIRRKTMLRLETFLPEAVSYASSANVHGEPKTSSRGMSRHVVSVHLWLINTKCGSKPISVVLLAEWYL